MDFTLSTTPQPHLIALADTGHWITRAALHSEAGFVSHVNTLWQTRSDLEFPSDWLEQQKHQVINSSNTRIDPAELGEQLDEIFTVFSRSAMLTIITGPPGAAKSTIASLWIRIARARYPDLPVILTAQEEPALQRLHDRFGNTDSKSWTIDRALKLNWPQGAIIVADEAGLFGTDTLTRLFQRAKETGARKIILIGDDKQLVSDTPGQPFRWLCEQAATDKVRLLNSFRQKNLWLREAVRSLYQNDMTEAMRLIPSHFVARNDLFTAMAPVIHEADSSNTLIIVHGTKQDITDTQSRFPDFRVLSVAEAQGLAIDRVLLLMLKKTNMAEWLVGCSRQRFDLDVFVDTAIYADAAEVIAHSDPYPRSTMALDLVTPEILLQVIDQT